MSNAALDRLLAVLIAVVVATGGLTLRAGSSGSAAVYVTHDIVAAVLLGAVLLKVRRSAPRAIAARRHLRLGLGLVLTAATMGALIGGFAWVASGSLLTVSGWTVLTIHAWFGLLLAPLVFVHLLPRRWRLLRPRLPFRRSSGVERGPGTGGARRHPSALPSLSRRSLLSAGALATIGGWAWFAAAITDRVSGHARRFTGSRWLPRGGIPPTTTFLGDATPQIDPKAWRLHVHGLVEAPFELDLSGIRQMPWVDQSAVLDCTSGWALETTWTGIPLASLLERCVPGPSATRITVRSVTGWSTELPLDAAGQILVATGVAGAPLPAANGGPCRLVVPDRRGLDWVKWLDEVEVA